MITTPMIGYEKEFLKLIQWNLNRFSPVSIQNAEQVQNLQECPADLNSSNFEETKD